MMRKEEKPLYGIIKQILSIYTLFYRFNHGSCGVPVSLEAKVMAAIGFLVQADPHFTVAFLENTHKTVQAIKTTHWPKIPVNELWIKNDILASKYTYTI